MIDPTDNSAPPTYWAAPPTATPQRSASWWPNPKIKDLPTIHEVASPQDIAWAIKKSYPDATSEEVANALYYGGLKAGEAVARKRMACRAMMIDRGMGIFLRSPAQKKE